MFYADREEIDYALLPRQPDGNSRRMTHILDCRASAPLADAKTWQPTRLPYKMHLPLQPLGGDRFAFGDFAGRQLPGALFFERQREQFSHGQLLLIAERGHADGDLGLRNITPKTAMNLVPPQEIVPQFESVSRSTIEW